MWDAESTVFQGLVWLWGADFVGGERVFISLGLSGSTDEKQQNQCADYQQHNKTPMKRFVVISTGASAESV